MNNLEKYIETVRSSSAENEQAIYLLYTNQLYNNVVATLRRELDLYVKTLYLLNQSEDEQKRLLAEFSQNKQWTNSRGKRLTDRCMLDYASNITGSGWAQISYKFGCSFIHLSILHNWANNDVDTIPPTDEKQAIVDYINHYHVANLNLESSFSDVMQYSLCIFEKIRTNMESYLERLELI